MKGTTLLRRLVFVRPLMRKMGCAYLVATCATACFAAEYFVSSDNYGKEGLDGLTEETAFGTIQDAIDAAETNGETGDIVTVLPGVYDKGGKFYVQSVGETSFEATNRVMISEGGIKLRSRDGANTAIIKGAVDPAGVASNNGIGHAAVGCVIVLSTGANVTIEGFTLLDGHTQTAVAEGFIQSGSGGAVNSRRSQRDVYVVDCIARNCAGGRGGAFYCATVVRTEIVACASQGGGASLGRDCNFLHCLMRNNLCSGGLFIGCRILGCTVVENYFTDVFSTANDVANSVFLHNSVDYGPDVDNGYARNSAFADIRGKTSGSVRFSEVTDCIAECTERQFFAPLLCDYRPLNNAQIANLGRSANLAVLSGHAANVDLYRSLDGVTFAPEAVIPAGCYHKLAPTPGGGCIQFNKQVRVEGYEVSSQSKLYVFFEKPGESFKATAVTSGGTGVVAYDCSIGFRFPEMDDSLWMMSPPAGVVVTNNPMIAAAANVRYVNPDPAVGSDSSEAGRGLSAEKPFHTLQYAIDAAPHSPGVGVLILAAEGVYDQGEKYASSHTNRVAISGEGVFRIKGAGREKSTILGRRDPASPSGDGRGPDSCRCVSISALACVQGFTLKDGCCSWEAPDGTVATASQQGGAVVFSHSSARIADCTITGASAYRGSAVFGNGEVIRTIITNNTALTGGMIRSAALHSCLIANNWGGGYNTDGAMTHCTAYAGASDGRAWEPNISTVKLCNNIFYGRTVHTWGSMPPEQFSGNIFWNVASVPTGQVQADPCFVDPASGDYRVFTHSPALTAGVPQEVYWAGYPTDLQGKLRRYVDGRPIVGALSDTPREFIVAEPQAGTTLVDGVPGTYVVEAGTSVSVTYSGYGVDGRPLLVYDESGELVATNVATYVCSLAADYSDAKTQAFSVPLYQSNIYVDPIHGLDGNSGWRKDAPKQTLAGAMAIASSGDTVHATAGTYDQGTMLPAWNASATIAARVHVKSGVTLVADDGPEKTFIVGKDAPSGTSAGGGVLGAGAVRGTTVSSSGCLRGFTVTGGRTLYSGSDVNYLGGGVLGESRTAQVVGCVISNNCASRGGGGSTASFVNCRIVGNYANLTSCGLYTANAYGCLFSRNLAGGSQLFRNAYAVNGCTFADDNTSNGTTPITSIFPDKQFSRIENTVFLGKVGDNFAATNCIFVTGEATGTVTGDNRWMASKAEVGLDANFVPVKGGAAIDNGDDNLISAYVTQEGVDAAGVQRIYNGHGDIGAFEYDWRGDYKADLGNGRFSVSAAAPTVIETMDGRRDVFVRNGEVELLLPAVGEGYVHRLCTLNAQVTGQGTLVVSTNGMAFATIENGAAQTTKFKVPLNEVTRVTLAYARHAGDDDSVGALLTGFETVPSGFCLIVK